MSRKSSSASAQKILIVDDEADVTYSFQRVLAEEPVEVEGVTSGT
jgi:CheY-like chemotaxis protein